MSGADETLTLLLVEDNPGDANLVEHHLRRGSFPGVPDQQALTHVESLAAAFDALAESSFDVVLLDRRMPDKSGDDVLAEIRERELDCRVVMITAVDPDFDIIEMPFDDYLCKPVESDDLLGAVEQQLSASEYDDRLSEYYEVTSKLALLEAEKTPQELQTNDDVVALRERAEELKSEMDEALTDFDDFEMAFREIGRHPGR